jgi:hypothetical protein
MTKRATDSGYKLPKVNSELSKAIIGISLYVSAMRGCVSRDKYRRDYIKSAPYAETGIRFAKMLAAIASVRAFMFRRTEATLEDLPLLKKIALDTINQRDEELVRNIYFLNKDKSIPPYRRNIEEQSSYTPYTIRCVLEDLVMLKKHHSMCHPFRFVDKSWIVRQYHKQNKLDLYNSTRSCEGDLGNKDIKAVVLNLESYDPAVHTIDKLPKCGECWWCKEREWAEANV